MLRYLLAKEFKQLFRNTFLPKLFLFMPLMMVLVFPHAANQEVRHLSVVVVDHAGGVLSRRLVEKVRATPQFDLRAAVPSFAHALRLVEEGDADLILEIPRGFEREVREGRAVVAVAANAVNGTKAGLGMGYCSQVVADFGQRLVAEGKVRAADTPIGASTDPATAVQQRPLTLAPRYLFNPTLDYKHYMIPAIIAMLLVLVVGFLPTFNIVGEKERGTMEQINVSPIRPSTFVLSKLIPYWCVGLFLLVYALLLAGVCYGLWPQGSVAALFLFAMLFILIVSSLALVVSCHSDTMQSAAMLMYFFLILFILMSGLLTPVASMPDWAQWVAAVNPFRYFMEAMRSLYLKGASPADLRLPLAALATMAAASGTWAALSYRKQG